MILCCTDHTTLIGLVINYEKVFEGESTDYFNAVAGLKARILDFSPLDFFQLESGRY